MSIAVVRRDGLAHDVRPGQRDVVYLAHEGPDGKQALFFGLPIKYS